MLTWLSRHVAWPLWELDNGTRVRPALRALERTQWLPPGALRERQWPNLRGLLADAYAHCGYYRDRWDAHGLVPSTILAPADLRRIPILTKRDIQQHGRRMFHDRFDPATLVPAKTGGSTGTSLAIFADRACRDQRNAAAIRSDRWAGWDVGVPRAALWGNPPVATTVKQKLRAALRDRLVYFDTMDMSDRTMAEFVETWARTRPRVLFGHAHSLYIWAAWLERQGIDRVRPEGVISTSMMLLPGERAVIERVFGCCVTDRYGSEETGLIAAECERHAGMHINVDHLFVEFLRDDDTPASPGEPAQLVITDLINRGMPLVRYRIEDVAIASDRSCPCGRGLPLLERIVGRTADFLVRADGSLVAGVSLVERTLTAFPGIEQMQIVQREVDDFVLHLVPMAGYASETERGLVHEFRRVFGGPARVHINQVPRIPQQASGKYRFAISHVARAQPDARVEPAR